MTAQRQEKAALRRRFVVIAACGAVYAALAATRLSAATTERVVADRFTGLAIGGIDPVTFFTDRAPLPGDERYELSAEGVVWRFRNSENRSVFAANPEIYGPQFGGYDPIDVGRGVSVAGRVAIWSVHDQRLYLFAREDSKAAFAADPAGAVQKARARWERVQAALVD